MVEHTRSRRAAVVLAAALALIACRAAAAENPAAAFRAYSDAVNAGDIDALKPLLSPAMSRPPLARCPPAQSGHDCMIGYITETVIQRHGRLATLAVAVTGDTAFATVELRNDMTRTAGIDRIRGTDRVRVKDGLIVAFAFLPDPHDSQTATFFDYMRQHAGPPPR